MTRASGKPTFFYGIFAAIALILVRMNSWSRFSASMSSFVYDLFRFFRALTLVGDSAQSSERG